MREVFVAGSESATVIAVATRDAHAEEEEAAPPASSNAASSECPRLRMAFDTVTTQPCLASRSTRTAWPSGILPCQTVAVTGASRAGRASCTSRNSSRCYR